MAAPTVRAARIGQTMARPRFTLRWVFIAVTLFCCLSGYVGWRLHAREQTNRIARALEKQGVCVGWQNDLWGPKCVLVSNKWTDYEYDNTTGRLVANRRITIPPEELLSKLAELPLLTDLHLCGEQGATISPDCISELDQCRALHHVLIEHINVTNGDWSVLGNLRPFQRLDFYWCNIGDDDLRYLTHFKGRDKRMRFAGCDVSEEKLEWLRSWLPKCRINGRKYGEPRPPGASPYVTSSNEGNDLFDDDTDRTNDDEGSGDEKSIFDF